MLGDSSKSQMASARRILSLCREIANALHQARGLRDDMDEIRNWISARPSRTLSRSVFVREKRVFRQLDDVGINFDEIDRKLCDEKNFLKQEGVNSDLVVAAALIEELGNRAPELAARIEEIAAQKREVIERMDAIEADYDRGATRQKFVVLRKQFLKLEKQWEQLDSEFWKHAVGEYPTKRRAN